MTDTAAAPSIAAILVSYNSEADLAELLPLLLDPRIDVVVVDNLSTDDSADVARAGGATVIQQTTNAGWAVACNVGSRHTQAEVLAFVNPDARPTPEDLLHLAAGLSKPGIGMTAPRFVDFTGQSQAFYFRFPTPWSGLFTFFGAGARIDRLLGQRYIAQRHYNFGRDVPDEVDQPGAACVAVTAAEFARLGGFDEAQFLFFADTDLCLRMAAEGLRAGIEWDVEVPHRQGGSVLKLDGIARHHYLHRDYLVYARRHYGVAGRLLTGCAYVVMGGLLPACAKLARGRPCEARRIVTLMLADLGQGRFGRSA